MKETKLNIEPELGSIPAKGMVYQTCCAWPKATYSSLRKKQTRSKAS